MMRILSLFSIVALSSAGAAAQSRFAFPPAAQGIEITHNVEYGMSAGVTLRMDVYRPPHSAGAKTPALIFFNRAFGDDRGNGPYAAWAQAAASNGITAILPDLRDGSEARDFDVLVKHLAERGGELGIDRDALAVYGASGNVWAAFPAVEEPAQTSIKAAVMYYGTAELTEFRRDLPVLYVRAGLDRPPVNAEIGRLAALAVSQNAPLTLLNHASGHHGFEFLDDDDATRDVIARTIDFVKRATSAAYQTALRQGLAEATAAAHVSVGKFHDAASAYATLLRDRPEDARLRLAYGEALLGDARYAAACSELEKLKGKGLGYRDLGIPAARACAQAGEADKAVAWIASIPVRFRPASIASDPALASVKDRLDFRALFEARPEK